MNDILKKPLTKIAIILLFITIIIVGFNTTSKKEAELAIEVASTKRPNILLLLADDLGYNDVTIYNNNSAVHTPSIDQLAHDGAMFTRHYTYSTCSPSRAALLTGMYPARNGFYPNGRGIAAEVITLPEFLNKQGYTSHHIGKWHTGDTVKSAWPDAQGFTSWFGFLNQWRLPGEKKNGQITPASPTYHNPWLRTESSPEKQYKGHLTEILTQHAIKKIKELKTDSPWFINLWFYAPHGPLYPKENFQNLYPNTDRGKHLALIHQLDNSVKRILHALDETGQRKNTIVIFASDNGGTNRAMNNNAPFTGSKASFHEGGVRTPMIIRWPHKIPTNTRSDEIVTIFDIYPTLVSLIGAQSKGEFDGVDFSPALQGQALAPRTLFWEKITQQHAGYSVLSRDGNWKITSDWPWYDWKAPVTISEPTKTPILLNPHSQQQVTTSNKLQTLHLNWQKDVYKPKLSLTETADKLLFTGFDNIRSPGFGGFTYATAITKQHQSPDNIMVQQGKLWQLRMTKKGQLRINFGSHIIQTPWPTSTSNCTPLIITGDFQQRLTNWKSDGNKIEVKVYIDQKMVKFYSAQDKLDGSDISMPTIVNRQWLHQQRPPIILSRSITDTPPHSIKELSQSLCLSS